MRLGFFGDSYDIVKQSLLRWLRPLGPWGIHPMFTDEFITARQADDFAAFLGIPIITNEPLRRNTNRDAYFSSAREFAGNVFLDPDTGVRIAPTTGSNAPSYLFLPEVISLATARPERLVMVFDQSLARGSEEPQLRNKLKALASRGILGFAYISHACFLVAGVDHRLVMEAHAEILAASRLPPKRLVSGWVSPQPVSGPVPGWSRSQPESLET